MERSEFLTHVDNFGKISKWLKSLDLPSEYSMEDLPPKVVTKLSRLGANPSRVLQGYKVIDSLRISMAFAALSAAVGVTSAGFSAASRNKNTKDALSEIGPNSSARAKMHHMMKRCSDVIDGDYPFKTASKGQEYTLVHFAAIACTNEENEPFIESSLKPESLAIFTKLRSELARIERTADQLYKKKSRVGKAIEAINSAYHDDAYLPEINGLMDFDEWAKQKGVFGDFQNLIRQSKQCDVPIDEIIRISLN